MQQNIPDYLAEGDTIGIAATARWITEDQLQPAVDIFHSWGLKTKLSANLHTRLYQLAGTDEERANGMQQMIDDDEVKAIIIARGGYGTVRVIDRLNFTRFLQKPKWICGYSDITVLHTWLNTHGVATIHSTMPVSFTAATSEALQTLRASLFGHLNFSFEKNESFQSMPTISPLPIFGGNLSVLYSLIGSNCLEKNRITEHILFIEDVDEMLYHVDRMMMALLRCGLLEQTKAILLGSMTLMKDNTTEFGFSANNSWGSSAEETVMRIAGLLGIPVFSGFPAGHRDDNRAFYLGRPCALDSLRGMVHLRY